MSKRESYIPVFQHRLLNAGWCVIGFCAGGVLMTVLILVFPHFVIPGAK